MFNLKIVVICNIQHTYLSIHNYILEFRSTFLSVILVSVRIYEVDLSSKSAYTDMSYVLLLFKTSLYWSSVLLCWNNWTFIFVNICWWTHALARIDTCSSQTEASHLFPHCFTIVTHVKIESCEHVVVCVCMPQSTLYEPSQILCDRKSIHNAFSAVSSVFWVRLSSTGKDSISYRSTSCRSNLWWHCLLQYQTSQTIEVRSCKWHC